MKKAVCSTVCDPINVSTDESLVPTNENCVLKDESCVSISREYLAHNTPVWLSIES
jgi:hypothetical protein